MRGTDQALPSLGKLLVATDGRTVQEIALTQGRIIVGRTVDNDLQIDSRFVSRHHCQITTSANSCVIEDLNSTNGIYVKSRRVRRHYLNDGDVVLIGKHELIYVDERLARTRGSLNDTVPGIPVLQRADGADGGGVGEEVEETEVGLEETRDQS
jgi:pSer/pThr/pTyr-binding forkhead associated (FHA) protein